MPLDNTTIAIAAVTADQDIIRRASAIFGSSERARSWLAETFLDGKSLGELLETGAGRARLEDILGWLESGL
jgi:uncharacterized protein (DUF2384 family)